jgi:N-methylhydantoinase A
LELDDDRTGAVAAPARRQVVFDGVTREATTLFRGELAPGQRADGPALIHEQSATTVLPPGWGATIDEGSNMVLRPL